MPPRNSRTKSFKKYRLLTSHAKKIPMTKIYDAIFKPEECINNSFQRKFEDYKRDCFAKGLSATKSADESIKSDEDGDKRYVNKQWYRNRAKGYPDDYTGN